MTFSKDKTSYCLLLFKLTIYIICVHFAIADQCETASTTGKEFVFGLIGGHYSISGQEVHLLITSTTTTTTNVQVIVPFLNIDEKRSFNNSVSVTLSGSILQYQGTPKQFKAIEVYSDFDISLAAIVEHASYTYMCEGILVLPKVALGTRYVAASYHPWSTDLNEILVIGTEPNTDIQINYTLNGAVVSNSTRIMPYETYQISVNHDLSGALIASNKPVAVVSGSALSKIPVNMGDYQALMEQLVPTKYWGHNYVVPPIYPRNFFILKLFAAEDGTEVHYYNATRHAEDYLNKGTVLEIEFGSSPVVIVSNKPIQIVQFGMDIGPFDGDPFMTTAQSVTQFSDSYKLITPHGPFTFTSTIVITIEKTKLSGLRLNGSLVTNLQSIMMSVPEPLNNYVTIFANVTYGETYNVHHLESGVLFGASLYGTYSTTVAYGYPLMLTLDCNTDQTTGLLTKAPTKATVTGTIITEGTTKPTATSPSLSFGSTTDVHHANHWTQQQHIGNGTWCFQCQDMYSLANCDIVTRCSDSQICYVERYNQSHTTLYRSGCIDKQMCSTGHSGVECLECCDGQFCNTRGCGNTGIDNFQSRGPVCFDCAYQSDEQLCKTVQLCATNQVCSIETYTWGNGLSHTKKCADKHVCGSRASTTVQTRNSPLCSQCCSTDFCNIKCTTDNTPSIIG